MLVEHLGTRSKPWQLTASIQPHSGSHDDCSLYGNTTVPFTHGWVNFTSLQIDCSAHNIILDFHVTYPNTSSLAVSSAAFNIAPRPYFVVVMDSPDHHGDMHFGEDFNVIIELRDGLTRQTAENLYTKVSFACECARTNWKFKTLID